MALLGLKLPVPISWGPAGKLRQLVPPQNLLVLTLLALLGSQIFFDLFVPFDELV